MSLCLTTDKTFVLEQFKIIFHSNGSKRLHDLLLYNLRKFITKAPLNCIVFLQLYLTFTRLILNNPSNIFNNIDVVVVNEFLLSSTGDNNLLSCLFVPFRVIII